MFHLQEYCIKLTFSHIRL